MGTKPRTWRDWFFEVFAPNSYVRPLQPLPLNEAERLEREREAERDVPADITRLKLTNGREPRSRR